jgi:hypothetical protein
MQLDHDILIDLCPLVSTILPNHHPSHLHSNIDPLTFPAVNGECFTTFPSPANSGIGSMIVSKFAEKKNGMEYRSWPEKFRTRWRVETYRSLVQA